MKIKNSFIIAICLITLFTAIFQPLTSKVLGNPDPVSDALDYLRSVQQPDGCIENYATSSWATMAIAAAGEDPHTWAPAGVSIVDYLKNNTDLLDLNKPSDIARFILSMTAAGENPYDINGTDYVALLKGHFNNGQIGETYYLFDDFWGVIALVSAGEPVNSTIIQQSLSFIQENQNPDGGWSWGVGYDSDVDDTAAAIMALISAGRPESSICIRKARNYLKQNQQPNGGFPSWGETNSGSDSWGISGIVAINEDPAEWTVDGNSVIDHLLSLQNPDGSFNWSTYNPPWVNKPLLTSYAIVALCYRQYPVNGFAVYLRIEGSSRTIWRRRTFVSASIIIDDASNEHLFLKPTALGALDTAAEIGGFNYKVQETAWGLYLYSVAGEDAAGMSGWLYRVDYVMPWVGADNFVLNETSPPSPPHREVLFYYGEWTALPIKLIVNATKVQIGNALRVQTLYYNDTSASWEPLENATVFFMGVTYLTDSSGSLTVTVFCSSWIRVEKQGFVRSDRIWITALGIAENSLGGKSGIFPI